MKVHFETKRLIVRDFIVSDYQGIYELDSDPDVHTYLGNKTIKTIEEAKTIVKKIMIQYQRFGIGRWAIIDKELNDFVGWTGLKYEQELRKDLEYYDLGYRLRKIYWGKGIGTETAIESLKYGFTTLNLSEICAAAHIHNIASNKILRKAGLKFKETFDFDGTKLNWYKLKRSEWLSQ